MISLRRKSSILYFLPFTLLKDYGKLFEGIFIINIYDKDDRMIIGMRTIKTAIAVTLSVTLAYMFKLDSPFFAAIASIIAMQGNLVDSFRMGRDRILGTILGATIGLLGSLVSPGNPVLLGIGIIIVIYVSNKLKWNKSVTIACVVFISIMLNLEEGNRLYYSLNRVLDTLVGIVVAVAVNFIISPPYSKTKVFETSEELIKECRKAIKILALKDCNLHLKEIASKLETLNKEYPIFKREVEIPLYKSNIDINLDEAMNLAKNLYRNIDVLVEMGHGYSINEENAKSLNKAYNLEIIPTEHLTSNDIVYNYHLKSSLDLVSRLSKMFKVL